jgi:nucleotide-binding universal stress UspA family protein
MPSLTEALVYVDPTPRGDWALALARQLPAPLAARLHLLATREDLAREPGLLERARAAVAREGVAIRVGSRPGPAERAVVAEARDAPYGLLVVPPAGRGAVRRMLQGSRVATVVRSVRAPVLVARRPPPRIQRILAALSGGGPTSAVAAAASGLAARWGAAVTYLHVASEVALPFHPARSRAPQAPARDPVEACRAALAEAAPGGELLLHEGLVVEEVLEVLERGDHDLLVLGASAAERSGALGPEDVTERLLLGCPVSTLVVPESGLAFGSASSLA